MMRHLWLQEGLQIKQIAARYSVGTATAWLACHGETRFPGEKSGSPRRYGPRCKPLRKTKVSTDGALHPSARDEDGERYTYNWVPHSKTIPPPKTTMPGSQLQEIPLHRLMGPR